jgi:predicted RNA-binding protein
MTQYWLCIVNRQNWEVVRQKKIWGVAERHRNTAAKVQIGDHLVFYVVGEIRNGNRLESAVCGRAEVASDVFRDTKRIFASAGVRKAEIYPLRIRLTNLVSFKELAFKPLISDLSFIKNKRKWSGHLQGKAMRFIPEHDFDRIVKAAERSV